MTMKNTHKIQPIQPRERDAADKVVRADPQKDK
jgi:hypothetical protein